MDHGGGNGYVRREPEGNGKSDTHGHGRPLGSVWLNKGMSDNRVKKKVCVRTNIG